MIGPGLSIEKQSEIVTAYQKDNKPLTVSVNFVPEQMKVDYIFLSNSKRYVQLASTLADEHLDFQIIATSNVTKTSGKFDYTLKYSTLLDEDAEVIDNSFIMLLKVMIRLGVGHVALAGFDGYVGDTASNYINPNMEYHFNAEQAKALNEYVKETLKELGKKLDIEFITESLYA